MPSCEQDPATDLLIAAHEGDSRDARRLLRQLLDTRATDAAVHVFATVAYAWLDDDLEFCYHLAVSLAIGHQTVAPITALGQILAERGQHKLAAKVLESGWARKKMKYSAIHRGAERARYMNLSSTAGAALGTLIDIPQDCAITTASAQSDIVEAAVQGRDSVVASLLVQLTQRATESPECAVFAAVSYAWLGLRDPIFFDRAFALLRIAHSDVLYSKSDRSAAPEPVSLLHDAEEAKLLRLAVQDKDKASVRKIANSAAQSLVRADHVQAALEYQWLSESDSVLFELAVAIGLDPSIPEPYLCISRVASSRREISVQESILTRISGDAYQRS